MVVLYWLLAVAIVVPCALAYVDPNDPCGGCTDVPKQTYCMGPDRECVRFDSFKPYSYRPNELPAGYSINVKSSFFPEPTDNRVALPYPFVLGTATGQTIDLRLIMRVQVGGDFALASTLHSEGTEYFLTVGTYEKPDLYACTDWVALSVDQMNGYLLGKIGGGGNAEVGGGNGDSAEEAQGAGGLVDAEGGGKDALKTYLGPTHRCTLPAGVGGPYLMFLQNDGGTVFASDDTITFPAEPVIDSVTGCTPHPTIVNATSDCPTAGGGLVLTVTGSSFYSIQPPISVFINSAPCLVVQTTVPIQIKCILPPGVGLNRGVMVSSAGGLSKPAEGRPLVSYAKAVINTMRGCALAAESRALIDCSRTGGERITLNGTNFGAADAKIIVDGKLGTDVVHDAADPHSRLSFMLPNGTGLERPILFAQTDGQLSPPTANLNVSYLQCAPGYYSPRNTPLLCVPCPMSLVSTTFDADICTACPSGSASGPPPSSGCVACPVGTSNSNETAIACEPCALGRYQQFENQPQCTACQPGTYSAVTGATACVMCDRNTASGQAGATACEACVGIRYQNLPGQSSCSTCSLGQYRSSAVETCQICPDGALCTSEGIFATSGYYVYFDESDKLQSDPCLPGYCVSCDNSASAIVTSTGANGTAPSRSVYTNSALGNVTAGLVFTCCSSNRVAPDQNPFCGACNPNYFLWAEECAFCDETNGGLVFAFVLLAWFSVTVFHFVAQLASPDMRIFINFVQFVFLFLLTQSSTLSAYLAIFNLNIAQAIGSTCVAPLTDMQRLTTGILVPVLGFALLCGNVLIHFLIWSALKAGYCRSTCCWRSDHPLGSIAMEWAAYPDFHPILDSYRRTALAFLATSYPSVTQSVLTFFSCKNFNTDSFVTAYPSISCLHDAQYNTLKPIFVILLLIIIVLPLAMAYRLYQLNSAGVLFDKRIRFVYGGLIDGYTASKYYWEIFVLVKRLVIAVVALDAENNRLSLKFTYLCLCNILFFGIHFIARPFQLLADNYAESLSLITLIVLSLFLIDAPNPLSQAYSAGLTAMCFTVAGLFALRIILVRYRKLLDCFEAKRPSASNAAGGKRKSTKMNRPPPASDSTANTGTGTVGTVATTDVPPPATSVDSNSALPASAV